MSRIKRRRMWRTSRAKIAQDIKKLARNSCCRIANRTTTQKRSSKLTGTFMLTLILKELSEFREKISNEPAKAVRQSNKLYPTPNVSMDNFLFFWMCINNFFEFLNILSRQKCKRRLKSLHQKTYLPFDTIFITIWNKLLVFLHWRMLIRLLYSIDTSGFAIKHNIKTFRKFEIQIVLKANNATNKNLNHER